ncbi:hypothetical protein [Massilia rubra]|uniref:hypothetical protein n=1 Tax=Massilia rubra TaxID=2607910 RepID=UPI001E3E796A|nr:hypothetical protein [Massilia rubra]
MSDLTPGRVRPDTGATTPGRHRGRDGEIQVDPSEIIEARWFGPHDEWPERVPHFSVSTILVDAHRPA